MAPPCGVRVHKWERPRCQCVFCRMECRTPAVPPNFYPGKVVT